MTRRLAAAGLLALCGCGAPPPERPATPFLPDGTGLAVAGSPLRIDFGRAPEGVVPAISRALGPAAALPLAGCPAGLAQRLRWDDLELTFTAERFVGWRQGGRGAGLTCG